MGEIALTKTRGIPKTQQLEEKKRLAQTQQVEEAKRFAQMQRVEEAKRLAQTKQVKETQQLAQKKLLQARRFEGPLSIPPSIRLQGQKSGKIQIETPSWQQAPIVEETLGEQEEVLADQVFRDDDLMHESAKAANYDDSKRE